MKKKVVLTLILAGAVLTAFSAWSISSGQAVSGLLFPLQFIQQSMNQRYRDIYKEQDRAKLVKFSHVYHKNDVGAECSQCHANADGSGAAADNLLPRMAECYTCHDQKTTDCKYCHLEAAEPYSSFVNPKRELVFSHQEHITGQKLKCEDCHADVVQKGYTSASILPAMDRCMTCHNGVQAANDCRTCHTDIRFIRPDDHSSDFLYTHKQVVAASSNTNCVFCHTEESCQECHEGGNLQTLKKKDLIGSRGARSGGDHPMILESAHALDYVVTHRFDAKAKTMECQSCHEPQSFCGKCHAEGNRTAAPLWHANIAIHGEMARKDMESCLTCHQVDGKDVGCIKSGCHNADGSRRQ